MSELRDLLVEELATIDEEEFDNEDEDEFDEEYMIQHLESTVEWNNFSHPTTVRLRNKPFPFYDELDYVYRKDRATGACAENPTDVVEDITLNEEEHKSQYVASSFNESQNVEQEENSTGTPISARTTQPPKLIGKGKRKRNEVIGVVQDLATQVTSAVEIMSTCGEHIGKLAKCFQHESDCVDRRMIVHQEVLKIVGLSQEEVIKAGRKIALDPLEMNYFFSLQEEFKKVCAKLIA
ncbi:hypothetical protein Syun_019474 [Stephania yunnanensis]|uniref:Uncharacterized protein n=1 Tax=Stephania yunnanensis TaxID=152371 RepID=A0AAP0IU57_9MAGN